MNINNLINFGGDKNEKTNNRYSNMYLFYWL